MLIDAEHKDVGKILCYDKHGKIIGKVLRIDTDTMIGEQYSHLDHLGYVITKKVDVYKVEGPSFSFTKNVNKRLINSGS